MTKFCEMCDKKLSMFSRGNLCKECTGNYPKWSELKNDIQSLATLSVDELSSLQKMGKVPLQKLYSGLYQEYESDKELDKNEISTLRRVQEGFELSRDEAEYDNRVMPYIYANHIRETGELPDAKITSIFGDNILLKKGEITHYASDAILQELRSVRVDYQKGSPGVRIRLVKGVSYKVGGHRGHVIKGDRLVETSRGGLILTNQRVFLHPISGKKSVSIPIKKIQLFRCYENGLEIYKEGRDKGYFFAMDYGPVEISEMCLNHLLEIQS